MQIARFCNFLRSSDKYIGRELYGTLGRRQLLFDDTSTSSIQTSHIELTSFGRSRLRSKSSCLDHVFDLNLAV